MLSQKVRDILDGAGADNEPGLSGRARAKLAELQEELQDTLRTVPFERPDGGYVWWTYAGLAANLLLAGRITTAGGSYGVVTAWSVKFTLSPLALERVGGWKSLAALEPFWEPAAKPTFAELLPASRVQEMTLRRVQPVASIRCPPE